MFLAKALAPRLSRRGTVAVLTAACLTVIMAALAIALDGGTLLAERRHAQAGADAAALAWPGLPTFSVFSLPPVLL